MKNGLEKTEKTALHADLETFMVFPFRILEFRKKFLSLAKKPSSLVKSLSLFCLEFSEKC